MVQSSWSYSQIQKLQLPHGYVCHRNNHGRTYPRISIVSGVQWKRPTHQNSTSHGNSIQRLMARWVCFSFKTQHGHAKILEKQVSFIADSKSKPWRNFPDQRFDSGQSSEKNNSSSGSSAWVFHGSSSLNQTGLWTQNPIDFRRRWLVLKHKV